MLGVFFLILAALLKFYVGPSLLKTPLDVDSTTRLEGTASLAGGEEFPVKVTSITRADSEKSDGDIVVWENSSCVVRDEGDPPNCVPADDPQERLLTASTDKFATDRKTALAVNDRKYVSADAGEHKGVINKFPFETKKQAYPYWDSTLDRAVNAVYDGTTEIDGMEVYRFNVKVEDEPVTISEGVEGTYSSDKFIYVEPLTGAIVNQSDDQSRVTDEGDPFLALNIAFTDEQVKTSVEDAQDNVDQLNLVRNTLPIVSLVLGVVLLVPGILLWRRASREETQA
jgi:hypothetical protein